MAAALDARLFKFIVFGLHVFLLLVVLFIFERHGVVYQIPRFADIAPVSALYGTLSLDWLGHVREIAHTILAIFDGAGGILLVSYGLKRKHDIPKFFSVAVGSQLIFSSLLSVSLLGLVLWGGIWHFISAMVAIAMGGSAMITFSALALFWKPLMEIGRKQDQMLKKSI